MPVQRQTYVAKPGEVPQSWHVIDADGKILGRLASRIAIMLQGKHKPTYTPHVDTGDFVVVINAEKMKLTGRKLDQKFYMTYTRHPGGHKHRSYRVMMQKHPEQLLKLAVWRMMPTSTLSRRMLKKLKVYRGTEHPHGAQKPQVLEA